MAGSVIARIFRAFFVRFPFSNSLILVLVQWAQGPLAAGILVDGESDGTLLP